MVIGSGKFTLRKERPKVHVGATRVKKVRFVGNVCQGRSVENGMSEAIEIVAFTKDEIYRKWFCVSQIIFPCYLKAGIWPFLFLYGRCDDPHMNSRMLLNSNAAPPSIRGGRHSR